MTLTFSDLLRHAVDSIRAPQDEARWVKSIDLPRGSRWEALLLIVVISVILGQISTFIVLGETNVIMGPLLANPMMAGILQMSLLVLMVFAIFWIGRAMGGTGGFGDAILLVAWLQFIMACVQVIQTAALLLIPPLASLIGVVGFVLFFWLLTNFIAELHGFRSLGQVFLMVIVALVGVAFGLSLILAMIGVAVPGSN